MRADELELVNVHGLTEATVENVVKAGLVEELLHLKVVEVGKAVATGLEGEEVEVVEATAATTLTEGLLELELVEDVVGTEVEVDVVEAAARTPAKKATGEVLGEETVQGVGGVEVVILVGAELVEVTTTKLVVDIPLVVAGPAVAVVKHVNEINVVHAVTEVTAEATTSEGEGTAKVVESGVEGVVQTEAAEATTEARTSSLSEVGRHVERVKVVLKVVVGEVTEV